VVQDAFTAGGAQARQLRTENHIQLNDIVNWSSGKHLVKFGVNVPDWSRRGFDDQNNFGGTFYFASLADYAALRPYAFRQQQGSGHVVFWQKELGGFVQDEWKPRTNFSVTLGLRFNWQNYLGDNNNLGPRMALALAPRKNRKTVFRGGAGIFYDRTNSGPIAELLRYNGAVLRSVLLTDPGFPDPFTPGVPITAEPSDYVRFAPGIRAPYSTQFSIGIEQQVAKRVTLAATYRGAVGSKLFMSRDVNAPLPFGYTVRPDPSKGVVRQIESSGRQRDNALDVTLRGDLGHRFTALAQYTVGRSDNNTGGIAWFPANQYNPAREWGRADFDQRHRFNMLGSFNVTKTLIVGAVVTAASGKPYSLTTGLDPYRTGMVNARPGGVGRNTLDGPGYADVDLRCSRDIFLIRAKAEKGPVGTVAFDAFNVFNHVNYTAYIGNFSSPFFGHAVASLPARRLQLTVRVKF